MSDLKKEVKVLRTEFNKAIYEFKKVSSALKNIERKIAKSSNKDTKDLKKPDELNSEG